MEQPAIGTIIGDYRIISVIDQGTFGVVYEGTHTSSDERVAIKLLKSEWVGKPDVVARFHQEIRAIRALNHPNIIKHIASGTFQNAPYLIMEYVKGETLRAKLVRF